MYKQPLPQKQRTDIHTTPSIDIKFKRVHRTDDSGIGSDGH